ncbi:transcription initiation factor iia small subunit [Colletotrichum karsti]|uniref:Transcription initiation factor iia small subunit n=1 Tax=Colletotrichum karsti TaxID=1095194 RepID=A0A9P6IF75_9PEZI|nr:transcription initiation factor iia small subunit [Colletotrichum karsti]KAF9881718.1 transcription initiation factor iia small subunit [Colletotrichum karsti]
MLRQRQPAAAASAPDRPLKEEIPTMAAAKTTSLDNERRPLLPRHEDDEHSQPPTEADENETDDDSKMTWARRNQWIVLAIASGACAAFNGVFAKLTTTDLTTTISQAISNFLGLSDIEGAFEVVMRAVFFGLNLVFNGIMWTLFTKALAKGNSTTQVSIMNTSSNFVITAILGLAIFSESLPPLWWLGAALLVAGNVIIGRKDETAADKSVDYAPLPQQPGLAPADGGEEDKEESEDEDIVDLGDLSSHEHRA